MPDQPTLDPEAIQGLRALAPDDGGAFVRELIDIFLQETPSRLAKIDAAFAAVDAATVTTVAHSLKGSCGNFGATRLGAVSLKIEQLAKSNALAQAELLRPELHAAFAATREGLESVLKDLR